MRRLLGFTLIELLVGIVITVLIISGLINLMMTAFRLFDKGMSKIHVVEQAWHALERIKRDAREGTLDFKCESDSKLVLRKFLTDANDSISYDSKGFPLESDPVIYSFSGGNLTRNGKSLGTDFSSVRFLLKKDEKQWLPIICVQLSVEHRGQIMDLKCHIIPRFWASYEKCRYWVSNARGQPLKRPTVLLGN